MGLVERPYSGTFVPPEGKTLKTSTIPGPFGQYAAARQPSGHAGAAGRHGSPPEKMDQAEDDASFAEMDIAFRHDRGRLTVHLQEAGVGQSAPGGVDQRVSSVFQSHCWNWRNSTGRFSYSAPQPWEQEARRLYVLHIKHFGKRN